MKMPVWALRAILVGGALGAWFWTQAALGRRAFPEGRIGDAVLEATEGLNRLLHERPKVADRLLVATSALIDVLGVFLVLRAVFGPSLRPLLGLLLLFGLRQACQGLCALPPPPGMIWRHPGFPSLLVTYGTSTDLFFSGHTAIAVYGGLELAHCGLGPWAAAAAVAVALVEAATVLVLRAHYFMDVFTGAVTALWVWAAVSALAPRADALFALLR